MSSAICAVSGAAHWFQMPGAQQKAHEPQAEAWRQGSCNAIRLQYAHTRLQSFCFTVEKHTRAKLRALQEGVPDTLLCPLSWHAWFDSCTHAGKCRCLTRENYSIPSIEGQLFVSTSLSACTVAEACILLSRDKTQLRVACKNGCNIFTANSTQCHGQFWHSHRNQRPTEQHQITSAIHCKARSHSPDRCWYADEVTNLAQLLDVRLVDLPALCRALLDDCRQQPLKLNARRAMQCLQVTVFQAAYLFQVATEAYVLMQPVTPWPCST